MTDKITLDENSESIKYLCRKDKHLAKVIRMIGPIEYEKRDDCYAFLIHGIIEQMLSIKAGNSIYARLKNLCGGEITPDAIGRLTRDEIKSCGTSGPKARYILNVTEAVKSGALEFEKLPAMSNDDAMKTLMKIKGIGKWSAKMYLMFVLDRQDILPVEDVAFMQSWKWLYSNPHPTKEEVEKKCKKWRPYTTVASRYMYRALDMGLTKEKFHLYK